MRQTARLIVFLVLSAPAWAQSAPEVSGVSGTVSRGGSITLAGRGFGSKPAAAPYRWDDFDAGTPGSRIGSAWDTWSVQPGKWPRHDTTRVRWPGSQSALQDFTGGNYSSVISLVDMPDRRVYLSGWFYLTTWGAPSRNVKLLTMHETEIGSPVTGWQCRLGNHPSTNSGLQYVEGGPITWGIGGQMWLDGWHRFESWIDQGTPGAADGVWSVWIDGRPWTELRGVFITQDTPIRHLYLGFYFATDEGSPQPEALRWWDELYVDFSRARVEIGDAPTFDACTHREIQVPSAWSSDSIAVTVNQGSFADGAPVYLYVVDASGAVNASGYPLTIGGTSSGGGGGGGPTTDKDGSSSSGGKCGSVGIDLLAFAGVVALARRWIGRRGRSR